MTCGRVPAQRIKQECNSSIIPDSTGNNTPTVGAQSSEKLFLWCGWTRLPNVKQNSCAHIMYPWNPLPFPSTREEHHAKTAGGLFITESVSAAEDAHRPQTQVFIMLSTKMAYYWFHMNNNLNQVCIRTNKTVYNTQSLKVILKLLKISC